MAAFLLETGTVESASSTLTSLASQVNSIASSVNGYDTACEDFNFSGAKASIAANIQALMEKIKNAATIVETVVAQHTQLQNSLTFSSSGASETPAETGTPPGGTTTTPGGTTTPPGGTTSTGPSYTGPSYTGPSYTGPVTTTPAPTPTPTETPQQIVSTQTIITEVTEKFKTVEHAQVDTSQENDYIKQMKFNEAGYAMIGGLYVIACSSKYGKVGEKLELTLSDGSKIECLIGNNIEDGDGKIVFLTNDKWSAEGQGNIPSDLPSKIEKIQNFREETITTTATATPTTGTPTTTTSTAPPDTTSTVTVTPPPTLTSSTHGWDTLSDSWTVVSTKASVESYSKAIEGKVSQNANSSLYGDKCLSFAETHAYALYTGNTGDSAATAANYPHGGSFTSWYSDSKQETLQKIYEQVSQGKPVVIQVNGNKAGTSRHFVTVVGFRKSVNDTNQLSEKDLLIIDSWDGKVERMDQANSRFLTSGKDCGKSYSGYYLRVLKS